ncbi:hypothetical protein [Cronobacter turicensis]|uniref:hypothetical protein n=1 Tax=Cronobacter turicensis TaxID=413502 RepID=UPI0011AC10EA|nr:hypothetical protein [Cronobacter turicensis]TWR31813.1 hypothetical protein FQY85_20690 [Cronobacter turicensis]
MSTISNERLEKLSEYDCADRYEVMSMATELLALRKERERAEPVATLYKAGNSAKVIMIGADLTDGYTDVFAELQPAPPAPADTTAQQFESLAGKVVVPDGWKMVPVEPTKEMVAKMRYHNGGYDQHIKNGYAAMLAAAPEPCE